MTELEMDVVYALGELEDLRQEVINLTEQVNDLTARLDQPRTLTVVE